MNKEEIEFNTLCAEFLGFKNTTVSDPDFNIYENKTGIIIQKKTYTMLETMSMVFHSDWNWIMKIVEKIENSGADLIIKAENTILVYDEGEQISTFYHKTKIEAICNACVEFIKWFNNENK